MPGYDKIPTYLNPEQRNALTHIPPDLSDREIARYYTFTEKERELINRRRRASNRLGFAVQLALLKYPGRTLMEVKEVPKPVLAVIAEQVGVPASAFTSYGERENTLYEHLDELRRECGFRSCGWREYLLVARSLLADAMESDRPLPLIETALERLRTEGIVAPNMIHIERLVWIVLKIAERRLLRALTERLTLEQRTRLDGLLHVDTGIRGATRLSWLRQAPGVTSPKSIKRLLEVDNWTGFLRHFTHLTSGDAPVGEQKLELVAALMGMGMNLGLEKMAESCPYTYRQLSWSIDWHIREETLLAALANLDNFVLAAPLSSAWGDGTASSSDGMRFHVGVQAANAEYNAKYFHARRGANMYIHAADIWVPYGKPQIIGTNEEALYVIDALCHHESDLHIQEHYTDTGGNTVM